MKPVSMFLGTTGLNTVSDEARLGYDDTGLCDLAQAVNISIDATNRPSRRSGYAVAQAGEFHSLFCDGFACCVAKEFPADCSIMQVNPDGTLVGIRSGLTKGRRISWAQSHDAPFDLFYANGVENGVVRNGISYNWPDHSKMAMLTPTNIFYSPAPVGYLIAIVHGRMFVATEEALYYSVPFTFGCFDLGGSYLPWKRVTMIKEVKGGVFISTDAEVLFYAGVDISTAEVSTVSPFPAIPGSALTEYVEGAELGLPPGLCAVWVTREGVFVGMPTGEVVNINRQKIIYPEDVTSGAAMLRGYNFIHCMF